MLDSHSIGRTNRLNGHTRFRREARFALWISRIEYVDWDSFSSVKIESVKTLLSSDRDKLFFEEEIAQLKNHADGIIREVFASRLTKTMVSNPVGSLRLAFFFFTKLGHAKSGFRKTVERAAGAIGIEAEAMEGTILD